MRILSFRTLLGIIVILVGVLLLLNNLNIIDYEVSNLLNFWPLVPLAIGLNMIVSAFRFTGTAVEQRNFFSWGQFLSGLILIGIGVSGLGNELDFIDEKYVDMFWQILIPLLVILLGLHLLRNIGGASKGGNSLAFMNSIEVGKQPWRLQSGNYLAFMGGVDLDLSNAEIPNGETIIDLTAFMGGIDVNIPPGLPVIYEGVAFLGGITFLNQEDGGIIASRKLEHNITEGAEKKYEDKLIRIQGRAIMGGIDITENKFDNS